MKRALYLLLMAACTVPASPTSPDARSALPPAIDATPVSRVLIAPTGQSNAIGQDNTIHLAPDRQILSAPYPAVPIWDTEFLLADGSTAYDLGPRALEPRPFASPTPNMGIELSLGRTVDAASPGRWAEVKMGVSGSSLAQRWLPDSTWPSSTDNLFHRWIARLKAAQATFGGRLVVVWFQAESDATSQAYALAYPPHLTTLIAAQRAADSAWADTPWIVIELNAANTGAYKDLVRAAQVAVAAQVPHVTLVNADDLPTPEHYTAPQLDTLGVRVGQVIVGLGL